MNGTVKNAGEFGVLVIGDEVLNGKRRDQHLPHVIEALHRRGMSVVWSQVVGDHRQRLADALRWSQQGEIPVFCFGGIGATPDDVTRQAAADAFGTRLERHPEAEKLIEAQFGDAAYPHRVLMADLPADCLLIPNGYNRIPGFTLYEHHFFPGFPCMAWPMLEWVLEHYYPGSGAVSGERSLRVFGVRESELLPLMTDLSARHSAARFFSLPHLGDIDSIELGFRGPEVVIDAAFADLVAAVQSLGLHFEHLAATPLLPAAGARG